MKLRSLAYRTDLTFPRFDGRIEDRGSYLVVRTPANPGFYWGNFLLFDASPTADSLHGWPELFERELPGAPHRAFGWDSPDGQLGAANLFTDAGYRLSNDLVMTTSHPSAPSKLAPSVTVRPIRGPDDDLNVAADPLDSGGTDPYAVFKHQLRERYRAMVAAGAGMWLGAFAGDRIVGQLGLFHAGDGLVRYQSVETHPEFRRRGVCSTLISASQRRGLGDMNAQLLVIVAEENATAHRIYRAAGFHAVQRQVGMQKAP